MYLCSCSLSIATELDYRQYHLLPGPGVTSGALWCQSQKLALTPTQSLEIPTDRAEPSCPCQLFPKRRKRQGLFPSPRRVTQCFQRSAGHFCQSPPSCSAGPAGCCSPLAQLGQSQGTADRPKPLVKSSSWVVQNTPAVLSDTMKRVALARPETGSSASLLRCLPNSTTYSLIFFSSIKVLLL